jgi:hypothetical protein
VNAAALTHYTGPQAKRVDSQRMGAAGVGGGVSDKEGATSTRNETDVTKVDAGFEIAVKYPEKPQI